MRGATSPQTIVIAAKVFQPTLPVRGATRRHPQSDRGQYLFQPTLPVRGATFSWRKLAKTPRISTHAPRAGSDPQGERGPQGPQGISTHAPRAGSDRCLLDYCVQYCNFNPRSPCGERRLLESSVIIPAIFQPTLPVRGATVCINV